MIKQFIYKHVISQAVSYATEKVNTRFKRKKAKEPYFDLPNATPELLKEIRLKMKLEQQAETIATLISLLVVFLVFILILL